jgi:hypothetical protein
MAAVSGSNPLTSIEKINTIIKNDGSYEFCENEIKKS